MNQEHYNELAKCMDLYGKLSLTDRKYGKLYDMAFEVAIDAVLENPHLDMPFYNELRQCDPETYPPIVTED